jgi:hypothetical protein
MWMMSNGSVASVSTNQVAPELDIPVKPLKGKYDRRRTKAVQSGRGGTRINAGRKPNHAQHLARNTAAYLFRDCDFKARFTELLATENERLRFDVLCYVWDRLEGKPFVAENPNARGVTNVLNQDNRLQIAIQQLVPPKQERKRKKTQAVEASSEARQLTAGDQAQQSYVDATAQVIDSTLDGSK